MTTGFFTAFAEPSAHYPVSRKAFPEKVNQGG
jgi:hypothetical protein